MQFTRYLAIIQAAGFLAPDDIALAVSCMKRSGPEALPAWEGLILPSLKDIPSVLPQIYAAVRTLLHVLTSCVRHSWLHNAAMHATLPCIRSYDLAFLTPGTSC